MALKSCVTEDLTICFQEELLPPMRYGLRKALFYGSLDNIIRDVQHNGLYGNMNFSPQTFLELEFQIDFVKPILRVQ